MKVSHRQRNYLYINLFVADRKQRGLRLLSRLIITERPNSRKQYQQAGTECAEEHAEVTEDSAADLVGIAPDQEQSSQTCRRASESRTSGLLSTATIFTCPLSARAFSRSTILTWQLLRSICTCSRVCGGNGQPSGTMRENVLHSKRTDFIHSGKTSMIY